MANSIAIFLALFAAFALIFAGCAAEKPPAAQNGTLLRVPASSLGGGSSLQDSQAQASPLQNNAQPKPNHAGANNSSSPQPQTAPRQPETYEVKKTADISYGRNSVQKLDIYSPIGAKGKLPLIIWIHGGGFTSGDKEDNSVSRMELLASNGYMVASINYRLESEAIWPAQIQDAKGAVRHLRANAAAYQIDPDKIGALGSSAGGNLAALLGTSCGVPSLEGNVGGNANVSSCVQAVVDMSGVQDYELLSGGAYDSKNGQLFGCASEATCAEKEKAAGAITYVSSESAPELIINAQHELVPVNQARTFYDALKSAGADAKLIIVPGSGHAVANFESQYDEILAFFDAKLR